MSKFLLLLSLVMRLTFTAHNTTLASSKNGQFAVDDSHPLLSHNPVVFVCRFASVLDATYESFFLCGDRCLCFGLHHCFTLTPTDLCTSSLSSIACIHRPRVVLCHTHVYTAHQQTQIDLCVRPKCLASM